MYIYIYKCIYIYNYIIYLTYFETSGHTSKHFNGPVNPFQLHHRHQGQKSPASPSPLRCDAWTFRRLASEGRGRDPRGGKLIGNMCNLWFSVFYILGISYLLYFSLSTTEELQPHVELALWLWKSYTQRIGCLNMAYHWNLKVGPTVPRKVEVICMRCELEQLGLHQAFFRTSQTQ